MPFPGKSDVIRSTGEVGFDERRSVLLDRLPAIDLLHADKGCDSAAIRRRIEHAGAVPDIPPRANKRWKNCFSPCLHRNRNVIERMFGRLEDFRRIRL